MAINHSDINQFLQLAVSLPVFDVRSPAEYAHAHIPGAHSLPLFTDEQRARIGTAYKQASREEAIKIGLDAFGPNMRGMVERVEAILERRSRDNAEPGTVLVHCWRGGMRSAAVAWLLDLYGFTVYLLEGGYKAYRSWVLEQFEKPYSFRVIGGHTGAGKTAILHALQKSGNGVLDLEGIAGHKGSAFGGLNQPPQPGQEFFENKLAAQLYSLSREEPNIPIYVEDESQRIGQVNIPGNLFRHIQQQKIYFLQIPFESRLDYITKEYGVYPVEALINAIVRIKKRLGPLETKTAVNYLIENDKKACFRILLQYYDKLYNKALLGRDENAGPIQVLACNTVDPITNTRSLKQHLSEANAIS
jgi:tRNA 2-selenouridine synthase